MNQKCSHLVFGLLALGASLACGDDRVLIFGDREPPVGGAAGAGGDGGSGLGGTGGMNGGAGGFAGATGGAGGTGGSGGMVMAGAGGGMPIMDASVAPSTDAGADADAAP